MRGILINSVIEKLKEIETGEVGIIIFSELKKDIICSLNDELIVPLGSAAKIGIAFCIAKLVEAGDFNWNDVVEPIRFNPKEGS